MLTNERRRHPDGATLPAGAIRVAGRVRVVGTLQMAQRGPVLITDEGAWVLEADEDLSAFKGRAIVAEGVRHGLDHIRVDYVALAQASS